MSPKRLLLRCSGSNALKDNLTKAFRAKSIFIVL